MSKKKHRDEFDFDGITDVNEYLKMRSQYLAKQYKKIAEKTWEERKHNVDYVCQTPKYAITSDFNHS